MTETQARELLLVQAHEQTTDPTWSAADAAWATGEARRIEGSTAAVDALLARRAALAAKRLVERQPTLAPWLAGLHLPTWAMVTMLACAVGLGLALDGYGGYARVNILALPLLGLLAWNVGVYAVIAVQSVAGRRAESKTASHGLRATLARRVASLSASLSQRLSGADRKLPALARFQLAWTEASRPLQVARAATALHALAAAVALGLVAGLYLRGLALEYRAGWESTFFDASTVHALVTALLGPAAALIGEPLPSIEALARLNFSSVGGENARPWIHRIALTVVLVVVLPRMLLAWRSLRESRRASANLPLDLRTPYFSRLVRELTGQRVALRVQPYAHRLSPEREANLRAQLGAALGVEPDATFDAPLAYGEDAATPVIAGAHAMSVPLFSASATPEVEVHGAFARTLPADALLLVDETELRLRLTGPDAATRLEQRRRAWRAMLEAQGRKAVFVDLDAPASADASAELIEALHPR